MNPVIELKPTILPLLIALVLACFGFLTRAQATDLDGVPPNDNTADGSGVLISLTTGINNSGFGFEALNHDTSGNSNTAEGFRASTAKQEKEIRDLTASLKEQAAQIQKVSAKLEFSKPAAQMIVNNQ